uniref:Uncharacterized protein n=1 Tax=Pararge aegeria TaxID=116150 RepID=S4NRE1_9NEOP
MKQLVKKKNYNVMLRSRFHRQLFSNITGARFLLSRLFHDKIPWEPFPWIKNNYSYFPFSQLTLCQKSSLSVYYLGREVKSKKQNKHFRIYNIRSSL